MHKYLCLLLVCITLLAACAPRNTQTPLPTAATANTQVSISTPEPTQTVAVTPTSMNRADPNSMDACTEIVDTKHSGAGMFQVVFAGDEARPADVIYSEFGVYDDAQHNTLALWSEDTGQTLPYPLPADAWGPKISTDHRWILFRRDITETHSEFWVIGTDGKNEKKLGTVVLDDEMRARYPESYFALNYDWIPSTNIFYYYVDASQEFGPLALERFILADANSGQVTKLNLPAEVKLFRFAPDGSQMVVSTESDSYMVNTLAGQVQFAIPVSLNNPKYSPDGRYLIDFINEGVLRIDTNDGGQLNIPLNYTIMECCPGGDGPRLRTLPNFQWLNNTTLVMSSLISDQQFVIRPFEPNPGGWTFVVWSVDIANGTTLPSPTFNGDPDSVVFSTDGTRIAFSNLESGDQPRRATELYLADVNTGETLKTLTSADNSLPEFIAWAPDSIHYLYLHDSGGRTADDETIRELFLGEIGAEPVTLGNVEGKLPVANWLNPKRFSLQMGICLIAGYETINLISLGSPVQVTNIVP